MIYPMLEWGVTYKIKMRLGFFFVLYTAEIKLHLIDLLYNKSTTLFRLLLLLDFIYRVRLEKHSGKIYHLSELASYFHIDQIKLIS